MIVNITTSSTNVNYWKQERLIVKMAMSDIQHKVLFWTNLHGSQSTPIAQYNGVTIGNSAEVTIDLTDYVRTYPAVQYIYIMEEEGSVNTLNMTIKGLIDPMGVFVPYNPLKSYGVRVLPPTKMICSLFMPRLEKAEYYNYQSSAWTVSGNASMSSDGRTIQNIGGDFTLTNGTNSRTFSPKGTKCGVEYVYVKWISFTGVERCHIFEATKSKIETADSFSLMSLDNDFVEIKGRMDGLTIRLDGLNAYDMWYYSDLITSSNVQICFNKTTWTRVQVTSKSATRPDGDANNGKLEIAINWKRYDAISM